MECLSKKSNNAICCDFSSGKDKTAIYIGYGGRVIEAVWIDEYGNIEKVNNAMKKVKVKKLTKHQKTVLQLQTLIDQHAHDLRYKNSEIEKLKKEVSAQSEARNHLDDKLQEARKHIASALNVCQGIKGMQQHEVFQVIGRMQGRLEAAQGYDSYGLSHGTASLKDINNFHTTKSVIGNW